MAVAGILAASAGCLLGGGSCQTLIDVAKQLFHQQPFISLGTKARGCGRGGVEVCSGRVWRGGLVVAALVGGTRPVTRIRKSIQMQ